jgi:hypothetical protein
LRLSNASFATRSIFPCRFEFCELKKRDIIKYNPKTGASEHGYVQLPVCGYCRPLEPPQDLLEAIKGFVGL